MDSIRPTMGAPAGAAPIAAPPPPPAAAPAADEGNRPGGAQDRVTVSAPETEKSKGGIPNFAASFGDNNANGTANPAGPQNGTNGNAAANQPDPSGLPKASKNDEEIAKHVCASGCGCITNTPGQGTNALKVLEDRDQEVRQHEQEHLNEAGEHARGGPTFETYSASNGKTFVTGGKVNVDVSEVGGDPKKTADKMAKIRKAALAPRSPSQQDRAVEAEAAGKEATARAQMQQDDIKKGRQPGSPGSATGPAV